MIKISHFNILLVEDEILLMQSLARHIEELDMGFRVVCQTANGQDALKRLEKENIHLVITDIRMPVMDGLELAKEIHLKYPVSRLSYFPATQNLNTPRKLSPRGLWIIF